MNDLLQSIKSTSCFLQFGFQNLDTISWISEFWIQNFGIFYNIPLWVLYEPISIEKKIVQKKSKKMRREEKLSC